MAKSTFLIQYEQHAALHVVQVQHRQIEQTGNKTVHYTSTNNATVTTNSKFCTYNISWKNEQINVVTI